MIYIHMTYLYKIKQLSTCTVSMHSSKYKVTISNVFKVLSRFKFCQ